MSFLTAEWRKLCFANYAVDPEVVHPFLPEGTELDFFEGKCYVSLVGFLFDKVKLKGISVPFHTRFEEINLRFYVKRKVNGTERRGTVFISEIVSKPAIVWVANLFYNESYGLRKMHFNHDLNANENILAYSLQEKNSWQKFEVVTSPTTSPFARGSKTGFITEHYYGYSKKGEGKTNEYEVRHPLWEEYKVKSYSVGIDFGHLYGQSFVHLTGNAPDSVQCMEGSKISIEGKRILSPATLKRGSPST